MKTKIGEDGEKAERDMIEHLGFGSGSFHMGHEKEITFVGQRLKRSTNTFLGQEIHREL
jgi:hypothetical protein